MKFYKQFFVAIMIMCMAAMVSVGQSTNQASSGLTIGLRESPPFIIRDEGEYTGLSIDLWEHVASETGIKFNYKYYKDLGHLIDAIDGGEVDLSINPLTVTSERLKRFSFSQPYFISNMAIAIKTNESGYLMGFLKNLFSRQFFEIVILLFFIIFTFGFVLAGIRIEFAWHKAVA